MSGSQTIEDVTTVLAAQPDSKTRRYDRQLRLWAASGQSALEAARILVLGANATSTSILKNLVLPGVGHFTLVDDQLVTGADAGNNFFLEGWDSVGKNRAEECVKLLCELNEGVEGHAETRSVREVIADKDWLRQNTIIVAHNLEKELLDDLTSFLWEDATNPPLIVVRSAGFLAEVFIQFHEHAIIESHSETASTLRISAPFPSLLSAALSTPFSTLDPTDHSHIPYPLILVHALSTWRATHNNQTPTTYAEKTAFKKSIRDMKKKADEENFDEAEAQAWRLWTTSGVPTEITELLNLLSQVSPQNPPLPQNAPFYTMLEALRRFAQLEEYRGLLPLSGALPDMKSDTERYVALQRLYKAQAEAEKAVFTGLVHDILKENGVDPSTARGLDPASIDTFLKNAHALRMLKGVKWGDADADPKVLASALKAWPRETATHLALSALSTLQAGGVEITVEAMKAEVIWLVGGADVDEVEETGWAIGEIARSPTADLPNTAAFLGGLVAQEIIKMVTRQYVPVKGYCLIDLVGAWTGVMAV